VQLPLHTGDVHFKNKNRLIFLLMLPIYDRTVLNRRTDYLGKYDFSRKKIHAGRRRGCSNHDV
jgi:hypothetical protein